jgi:hypothetical protein
MLVITCGTSVWVRACVPQGSCGCTLSAAWRSTFNRPRPGAARARAVWSPPYAIGLVRPSCLLLCERAPMLSRCCSHGMCSRQHGSVRCCVRGVVHCWQAGKHAEAPTWPTRVQHRAARGRCFVCFTCLCWRGMWRRALQASAWRVLCVRQDIAGACDACRHGHMLRCCRMWHCDSSVAFCGRGLPHTHRAAANGHATNQLVRGLLFERLSLSWVAAVGLHALQARRVPAGRGLVCTRKPFSGCHGHAAEAHIGCVAQPSTPSVLHHHHALPVHTHCSRSATHGQHLCSVSHTQRRGWRPRR